MKRNNAQNSSAKKKLIPAVAMFTASAVMLSTATYAWFTMNKNAKVTGLNMTATAGGSIEISLGQTEAGGLPTKTEGSNDVTTPKMNNNSWKNIIAVSDYYDTIGKIKPASSIDGDKLFYAADAGVYAGGTAVEDSAAITATAKENEVPLTLQTTGTKKLVNATDEANTNYRYVDVPVWIRTTKTTDQVVTCDVILEDSEMNGAKENTKEAGSELQNAVRVAVIPLETNATADATDDAPAITKATSYSASNISVFNKEGVNTNMYKDGQALSSAKEANAADDTYDKHLANISYKPTKTLDDDTAADTKTEGSATVFTLKGTTKENTYSVQAFVVRVWLEGESTSCKDANAAQDWNIQLNFYGNDKTANPGT